MNIPVSVLEKACETVQVKLNRQLPFWERGIKVDRNLIESVIEILHASPSKTLPQNCRNAIRAKTPDGLDCRIKERLNNDLRTANIISDVLAEAGIVEVIKVANPGTGNLVKGTRLLDEWCWDKAAEYKTTGNALVSLGHEVAGPSYKKKETTKPLIKREDYLSCSNVRQFIEWLEKKLEKTGAFKHSYKLKKADRDWRCTCLYEAYRSYWWPFNTTCPLSGDRLKGTGPTESFAFLARLANAFRAGVRKGDVNATRRCALAMLEWGGVLNKNRERIEEMGKEGCTYFRDVRGRLNLDEVSLWKDYGMHIHMNSGFTKLYFLLVDNLIMYDGRVGAAMGLLVPCQQK